jgi:hypothetical protein
VALQEQLIGNQSALSHIEGFFVPDEITKELVEAYRKTEYWVLGTQSFYLSIGIYSPDVIKLHTQFECQESAFITAWNPYSEPTAPKENLAANKALVNQLAPLSIKLIAGEGRDTDGKWESEASFLAIGIGKTQAESIAREYRQNAMVYIGDDGIPELLLLR